MAIPYAGGVNRNDLYLGIGDHNGIITSIRTTLLAAGWTSQTINAFNLLTLTAPPAAGNTVTIGVTYTFRAAINNLVANEILIEATAAGCAANLLNAINVGPGSGVKYSSATVVNADVTASTTTTVAQIKTISKLVGLAGNGIVGLSQTGGVFTWYFSMFPNSLYFGGYYLTTQVTPQGLQAQYYVMWGGEGGGGIGDQVRIVAQNVDGNVVSNPLTVTNTNSNDLAYGPFLRVAAGGNWRVIANRYQFFVLADGAAMSTAGSYLSGGAPWIWDFLTGISIASVGNTTPIQISTVTPHGLVNGDNVRVVRTGVSAANGTFAVTVTGPNTLTLDLSTAGGASVSTGLIGEINTQIVELIWMSGTGTFGGGIGRINLSNRGTGYNFSDVNALAFAAGDSNGLGVLDYIVPQTSYNNTANSALRFYGNPTLYSEPILGFGTVLAGAPYVMCMTWDTVVATKGYATATAGSFDAHNWYTITDTNVGDTANCQASLLVVVP